MSNIPAFVHIWLELGGVLLNIVSFLLWPSALLPPTLARLSQMVDRVFRKFASVTTVHRG